MTQSQKNKEFILTYYAAISGHIKTPELLARFMNDPILIDTITFFDGAFPRYSMTADEMTSEGNRIVVRATMRGRHDGTYKGILPTHKQVEFPVVVSYEIYNDKIESFWLVADRLTFMEQLGIVTPVQEMN
ncbi:MAG: ester cyclase [Dyadobacter sp.]